MAKFKTLAQFKSCALVLSLIVCGCGGMDTTMNSNRVLQSMTISPATADAQMFTNGQVAFKATGTFSKAPSPDTVTFIAPYSGGWSVSDMNVATIDQNGMAQCVHGAIGTVTVKAIASANSAGPGQMSIAVSANAQLTCP